MSRKTVPLADDSWVPGYVDELSESHARLAECVHRSPGELRGEGQVLAALIEVGRRVVDEMTERDIYDQLYGAGASGDEDERELFAFYGGQSRSAIAEHAATDA